MAISQALQVLATALHINVDSIAQSSSFTSHGGDSITALRFSMECRRRGIFIPVDAVLSSPSISQLLRQCRRPADPDVETATEPEKLLVDSYLERPAKRARRSGTDGSLKQNTDTPENESFLAKAPAAWCSGTKPDSQFPGLVPLSVHMEPLSGVNSTVQELSDIQISLVHGSMESPGANIIYYGETHRPCHLARLREAWKQVCRAEPIFGTTYRNPEDGLPLRPHLHWREFTTDEWSVYRNALLAASGPGLPWSDNTDGVDLALRFTVLHYTATSPADSQATVIWAVHHALIDGWSAELLVRKVHLAALGENLRPGPSYTDLQAMQSQLRLARKVEGDSFWVQQQAKLATARDEIVLERPTANVERAVASGNVKDEMQVPVALTPYDHASLKAAAQLCGVTPAAFFYAAWAICLGLYTDSDNVVVGAVVSGRNLGLPGIFDTVGPVVNTLPLQVDLRWEVTAREFVQDVFSRMQGLSHYSWTTPENGFTRVKGNLMAMTPNEQRWAEGSSIGPPFFKHATNLPLSAIIKDDGSSMVLQYCGLRYTRGAIETLAHLFKACLLSLCRTEATLKSSNLVFNNCSKTLGSMGNWKSPTTTIPSVKDDLVTLFERTARNHPSGIAIERGDQKLTYARLERLSGQVASTLTYQIGPEEVVAVHADGSVNWIIAIYGILRAGGVYCPLDKDHPQRYRDSLFEASTARIFLATDADSMCNRPATADVALDVAAVLSGHDATSTSSPVAAFPERDYSRQDERAYLCFTSGSTGEPKGVMCAHQGLVAFQSDFDVRLGATVGTRIAQVMSVAFDGAIHEVFSALSYGATLVLRQGCEQGGLNHLKTVDCAILTPSLASVLDPGDFPRLKTVYLVGEMVPQTVCDTWAASKAVYNMYGPTEGTCGATIKRLCPGRRVTIGGPNLSTRVYILDRLQRLVPPGAVGEIYLAGVQVARGYIGRPQITAERFLPDPFCGSGEFMYKTGDRGYWDEAGDIVFQGRADRQIKLRGFRVDLEDLEARILRACSRRHGARAVAITNRGEDLLCLIQSKCADVGGMRDAMRKVLPPFAMPARVSVTRRLPMTPNMKVDYRAMVCDFGAQNEEKPPRETRGHILETETETAVAAVWTQVLDDVATATKIGPESNFLQLGGHSLLQMRLVSKLKAVFGACVTMRMVVDLPILRELAAAIDKIDKRSPSLSPSPSPSPTISSKLNRRLGQFEPGPMEKEWWHKNQVKGGTSAFNVSWVARYDSTIVDSARMVSAWNTVLARHVVFRARYLQDHEHVLQRVLALSPPRVQRRRHVHVRRELNRPFDLISAPPVRVVVTDDTVVAIWSHIVCDYTALSLILKEVAAVYHQESPPQQHQHQQQQQQLDHQRAPSDAASLEFWTRYLGDVKNNRHAYLGNGAERSDYDGRSLTCRVSKCLWHRVQARAQQSGVTLQQLLLAAVALAVTAAADDDLDVTLGTPFINRHSEADMAAIGLFLEPLPVRVFHNDRDAPLSSYVAAVQASSQQALAHAVPWDQLLDHLGVEARPPKHPLFDCVASFHDARDRGAGAEGGGPWSKGAWGDGVEPQVVWSDGAKFKLMVECLAYDDDTLLLRLEYATTCFGGGRGGREGGRVAAVRRMILTALNAIASWDDGCAVGDLRRELWGLWQAERSAGFKLESDLDVMLLEGRRELFLECFSQLNG